MKDPVQAEPSRAFYWQSRKVIRGVDAGEEEAKQESFAVNLKYGQPPEERWEFNGFRIVRNR